MIGWTEERVVKLKQLWDAGMSASRIASELGGTTRNAVIGKAHRLGLAARAKNIQSKHDDSQPDAPYSESPEEISARIVDDTYSVDASSTEDSNIISINRNESSQQNIRDTRLQEEEPLIDKGTVLQLTDQTCKWPIGDPGTKDFYFCCRRAAAGLPYCNYHAKIAYQAVEKRRDGQKRAVG